LLLASTGVGAADEYLKNADFKKGKSKWLGDGDLVFLKPDGTEGGEEDPGATPVLKLKLKKSESNLLFQEFRTKDKPKTLQVSVEIKASDDFKRLEESELYTQTWKAGSTMYWTGVEISPVDFWIRVGPGWLYKLAKAKKDWQKVEGRWENVMESDERLLYFCVPPGEGALYLRNPVVTP
jgi:hypothetical protein